MARHSNTKAHSGRPLRPLEGDLQRANGTDKFRTRQRRIIQQALSLLSEVGYANFSMRGLAERSEMQLGNLQYYFANREELVASIVSHWVRQDHVERRRLARQSLGAPEIVATWISDLFRELVGKRPGIVALEMWAVALREKRAGEELAAHYLDQKRYYGALIRTANPALSRAEAERRAMLLIASVEGLTPQVEQLRLSPEELAALHDTARRAALAIVHAD